MAARNTVVRYTVQVAVPNTERDNITTQLLSMIGTLVVAVSGFYFGARAVQAGINKGNVVTKSGAAIVRRGTDPPDESGAAAQEIDPNARGPSGEEADEDESAYGDVSPVARGPSRDEVREELHSPPLAEEDEAEESLREQGAEEPPEDEEGDEGDAPEEDEGEEMRDEDLPGLDEEEEKPEETPPPPPSEEEPPEKV